MRYHYISDKEVDDGYCISKQWWWRGLKLIGTFEFSDTNIWITAKLSGILAQAWISLCFIGTHDTDYILIQQDNLEKAIQALAWSWITILN